MKYDVFLSYKSEDHAWVENLKSALQKRGVTVWLDKDAIRPGDLFAQALENGIKNSRAIAIIITPQSMKSKWVQEEYYRALTLANKKKIKILPCLLQQAEIPGFLSSRQFIDFTDENDFERKVDKLVFPGITGKNISIESFSYGHDFGTSEWGKLNSAFNNVIGHHYSSGLSPSRMHEWTSLRKWKNDRFPPPTLASDKECTVIVVDMDFHGVTTASEFILECRNSHEVAYRDIVFVFYHPPNFFEPPELDISEELRIRFSHYYVIEKSNDPIELQKNARTTWNAVLQDLMRNKRSKKVASRSKNA